MRELYENVVVFKLEAGQALHIASKVDAELDQAFTVSRVKKNGAVEDLGLHPGGSSLEISPIDEKAAILIAGWAWTAPYWVPSKPRGDEKGVVIRCAFDDYYDDGDYNDLVVTCTRVAPKDGVSPIGPELPPGIEKAVQKVLAEKKGKQL
jgi:hypothetical protein